MSNTRLQNTMLRVAVLGVIVAGTANVAAAQKVKPAGPPVTTNGAAKSSPKADKGQATAQAARTEAREEKGERLAFKQAREQSKDALKGIKLTDAEKAKIKEIVKNYDEQYKALEKTDKEADKAGAENPQLVARLDALRTEERTALRSALATPEQQAQFDKNLTPKVAKKS